MVYQGRVLGCIFATQCLRTREGWIGAVAHYSAVAHNTRRACGPDEYKYVCCVASEGSERTEKQEPTCHRRQKMSLGHALQDASPYFTTGGELFLWHRNRRKSVEYEYENITCGNYTSSKVSTSQTSS